MDIAFALVVGLGLGIVGAFVLVRRSAVPPARDAVLEHALERLDSQLHAIEAGRERAYGEVLASLGHVRDSSDQVRTETSALVNALRAPHTRGRWGEMQLRRVIEAAGALEHCDFSEQPTVGGDDGVLRPDVVVHLAGGKRVVVDAKVPFSAYLEAMEARDEPTREERLQAHARQVRERVKELAAKEYWSRFEPTPEFVVLFVPSDAILDAALRVDPSLQETAFANDVVLATPSTLVALLRTIAYTWRQEALAANAREVCELGRELYTRLGTMGGHLDKLGRSLTGAVTSYNQTLGSLESRVLVTARRFPTLGVGGAELTTPAQVEESPRLVSAPELRAG
ncbi:MAG: recombination protein RmuC [Frankiales bacterium]|jgi:DNA recombination protein RmuC|nr:recombination protein RmuC [Frankiales bacterium]